MSQMTVVGSVNSVQTAYDRLAYYALRPELYFDDVATVKPTRQDKPGNPVTFTFWSDLAVASTSINESTDVNTVALSDSQVTVTLAEYGNSVQTSAKVRGTSFLGVDEAAANTIGFNAGISIDTLARDALAAGTNVRYSGTATSRNTVKPTDNLTADNVRRSNVDLKGANVMPFANGMYKAFIHPDISYDLRKETGSAAWRDPHTYSQPGEIWNGSVGAFEGFEFVETPRAKVLSDAGSSTTLTDVYITEFLGQQALAKAFSSTVSGPLPKVILGPVVDRLERFRPVSWYWLGGYAVFRQAALRRYESASTIGAN